MEYGIVSLLPTALVLILAVITQRTLESVIAGAIFAFILMDGTGFVDTLAEVSLDVPVSYTHLTLPTKSTV